jgi:hypothetical protein
MKNLKTLTDAELREKIKGTPLLGRYGPHNLNLLLQEKSRRKATAR